MLEFLKILSPYYIFLVPIAVWFIVQGIKIIIFSLKYGWDIKNTLAHVGHGHMPSAHTGFITALVTSVGYYEGMETGAFAVAVILAIIVIDDAVRLRMYLGDQGRYLNLLIEQLQLETKFPKMKERMGHKISEVFVGGVLGFVLTILIAKILG
jgi:acid phosphatase family membrane protein YuiD